MGRMPDRLDGVRIPYSPIIILFGSVDMDFLFLSPKN